MEGGDGMRPDDDLDTLLEFADGPRELPRGAEDRLLRSILRTAAQPRLPEELAPHDAQAIELATRRAATPDWLKVAAAITVAAGIAAIVFLGSADPPPAITPIGEGDALVLDVEDVEGAELCNAIALQVARSRLHADDVNVDRSDNQLPLDLAALLDELAARVRVDPGGAGDTTSPAPAQLEDLTSAVAALRLQAALLDSGDAAGAARARQRATALLLPLLPLDGSIGCPPPTSRTASPDA